MRRETKRILIGVLALVVPILFVLNVWQSYRFVRLERAIVAVQDEHEAQVERNKQLILGIAGLRSPGRVRAIATEELGMQPIQPEQVRRVELGSDDD